MKSIGLQNVKAFKDTGDIELAPLTIFVGQNSCGKSSFIRFPVVLSQTFNNEASGICLHSNQPGTIDYGNFQDVIYQHQGDTFSFSFTEDYKDLYERYRIADIPQCNIPMIIRCTISFTKVQNKKASEIEISKLKVEINNELAFIITTGERYSIIVKKNITGSAINDTDITISYKPKYPLSFSRYYRPLPDEKEIIEGIVYTYFDNDETIFNAAIKYLVEEYIVYLPYSERKEVKKTDKTSKLTKDQQKRIKTMLKVISQAFSLQSCLYRLIITDTYNMHYIGPFRNNPQRIYRLDESARKKVGHSGEYASDMLINDYFDKGVITQNVSKWFKESFGYSICVRELKSDNMGSGYYQITLQEGDDNEERNIMDVGYGISQVLPIVIQLAEATTKSIKNQRSNEFFVIEQPELHLHPAAQAKLASLFANAIDKGGWKYRRILVETHSEHFIRALQVMIADPNCFLTHEMVKVYYVNKDETGGSSIQEMKITENGQFTEEWPSGFFDKSFELSRALLQAIYMRKDDGV